MCQRPLDAGVFVILPVLVLGLALGAADYGGAVVEDQDIARVAPVRRGAAADVGDEIAGDALVGAENALGCVAANSRPRDEEPAWYSTGVRCRDGSAK